MTSLFLTAFCLFAADCVTGFGYIFKQYVPRIRYAAFGAGILMIITAHVQGFRPPAVNSYEITLDGLPAEMDGIVLAAVADLHVNRNFGIGWLRARAEQIQSEKPDIIVLVGDLFEGGGGNDSDLVSAMKVFSAPLGVWAVKGNHDSYGNREKTVREVLSRAGIRLLCNEWAQAADGLIVAGVEDLTTLRRRKGECIKSVERTLDGVPDKAVIYFSHTPWMAEEAAGKGAGLMLSGHTHAGQVWPFGYLVKLHYPYIAGLYEVEGMPLIVTRGAGTWGPRMRLWKQGEILRITLRCGQ